ncbi:polysaccharide pyruvyl transferase family protein [Nodosilinea sp. LEGE 07088]|uniref:polysaccharide pyruvyl transferase family protein n=1 Tax=Nodosilinea sp. LEGE 07088 TaxID=2777968 RepID=UPI0018813C61|nr:polysaccharide pyruvyl transferase family protein [Nodosilinea sp. LEGE 07088]MBE9139434.1 polysaccharide pyruvyl transferase family protein [Nodosilinea sp. LEGE 07088]
MNILVEQSGYPLANMGDLAMLEMSICRLKSLYPDAKFKVFNSAPEKLKHHIQDVQSLGNSGLNIWLSPLSKRYVETLPKAYRESCLHWEWKFKVNHPFLAKRLIEYKYRYSPESLTNLSNFLKSLEEADLVVATGGGYITDAFPNKVNSTLGILGLAQKMDKPTVMLGHGLGPFSSRLTVSQARLVLSRVKKITLREKLRSLPFLKSLGIDNSQIIVTGDDAIELSHRNRSKNLGNGVGINLRVAKYSNIASDSSEVLRKCIHKFAAEMKAPLVSIPIEFIEHNSDVSSIRKITDGYDGEIREITMPESPDKIAKQINHCRIVITGSYHAGVFALSQGIPVVAIVRSQYYVDKFSGLFDQFGNVGSKILFLEDRDFSENLQSTLSELWDFPEEKRYLLLEIASKQIETGKKAYDQVMKDLPPIENVIENL